MDKKTNINYEIMHLGELLKRISEQLEKHANANLKEINVTHSQMHILVALCKTKTGSATFKEIEKYFNIAQSTAAGTILRLEEKGLVKCSTDKSDKRAKTIAITDKGIETCEKARKLMQKCERNLLSNLTKDEQDELKGLLIKIYRSIE